MRMMSLPGVRLLTSLLLATGVVAVVAVGATAGAEPAASASKERASRCKGAEVNLNFHEAELVDVIATISKATGRRFILDGAVPATKITIFSPRPVCPGEAYEAFLGALAMNGLAVVRQGRYHVVMTAARAVRSPIPVVVDSQ